MKFLILNGSLTPPKESDTQRVIDRVRAEFKKYNVETTEIVLRDLDFEPGVDITRRDGTPDDMTAVMQQILTHDGLILATPIWWGTYSSYIQAVLERCGYFDDWSIENNVAPLYGKVFGAVINGTDDGWQNIYGQLFHYASYLGFTVPPDGFVSAVNGGGRDPASEKDFAELVRIFTRNQVAWAQLLKRSNIGKQVQLQAHKRTGYTVTPQRSKK